MAHIIFHNLFIKASAEKVYEAVSSPEYLENWWPKHCSGEPEKEAVYNFNFTDEYNWYAKVIEANRPKAFSVKMTDADPDWNPTSFGFDIVQKKDGVELQFWHKDWENCNNHFKIASFCWAMLLKGLKDYLKKGIIIDFKDRS